MIGKSEKPTRKSFHIAACLLTLLWLAAVSSAVSRSETEKNPARGFLRAGVATKELKVPVGHKMLSFPIRKDGKVIADRANRGTHDPVTVRCLVLTEKEVAVALVSVDVAGISNSMVHRIQESVAGKVSTPAENILIGATHTHHGPIIERGWLSTASEQWVDYIDDTISRTIIEAHQNLVPAAVRLGHGHVDLNYNRLFIGQDGRAKYIRRNPARRFYGPTDKEVVVLRVDREDGKPLAVVFNYALHGVVMHRDNHLISADFPGPAREAIEDNLGQGATAIYFNGAEGEMNPYETETKDFKVVDQVGRALAKEVLRVYPRIETSSSHELAVQSRQLDYQPRHLPGGKESITVSAAFLRDGTLVTVPGEMFAQAAMEFKRRSPFANNMILGLTGGAVGYIPPEDAYRYGGYGVDPVPTDRLKGYLKQVPMGFAEKIWKTWLEMTYQRWNSISESAKEHN